MDHLSLCSTFLSDIEKNDFLDIDESKSRSNKERKLVLSLDEQKKIPQKIIDYYIYILFFNKIWTYEKDEEKRGFINILPIGNPAERNREPDQYGLTMFDFFVPEAGVGYYVANEGEKPNDELYLLILGEKPYSLGVDLDGYIQLLYMARGFAYWQMVLLSFQNHPATDNSAVEEFKIWMPKIFPDFKWDEFVALYEKVKLR